MLELVPGKTLAERVDAGPLDVREALRICSEIAEGLEAAHDNIVHRDLKPANIKITAEGKVKVLDFGLAKTVACGGPRSFAFPHGDRRRNRERGDFRDRRLHEPGAGAGQPLNKRTDIWSFGCVMYELLSGQKRLRRTRCPTPSSGCWARNQTGRCCR